MEKSIHSIKNLSAGELVKNGPGGEYIIMRNGQYLGAFVKVGETYHFRDQQHNTWVCAGCDIDTGARDIDAAVAYMSY